MASTEFRFYTTGSWRPLPGQEAAFQEAWSEFARWAVALEGSGEATLTRDLRSEGSYVSFLPWQSMKAIRGWKDHPEFMDRMGRVQQFVDTFSPTEVEVVARVQAGA